VRGGRVTDLKDDSIPSVYLPTLQDPQPMTSKQFLIRSSLPPGNITPALSRSLLEVNPGLDISFQGFRSMVQESLLRERLMATLSGFFGLLALLLASIGLYGLLSYGVASRTNEIGIRLALGARTRDVLTMILREAFLLVLIGVAVGLPVVFLVTRFASALLFGLSPTDPVSLIVAAALLLVVAFLAGYLPARKATKIDPLDALRYE